jgi:hypothetical protein
MTWKLYTDAELGFHCDESLRDDVSSVHFAKVIQGLLVQIARQNERIMQKLEIVGPIDPGPPPDPTAETTMPLAAAPIPAPNP